MIAAGIDMGARTIKVVVLDDGRIGGKSCVPAGLSTRSTSEQALQQAFGAAGVKRVDVKFIMATGVGRKDAGVVKRLENELGFPALIPRHDTQIAGALGGALFAQALWEKEQRKVRDGN